MFKKDSSFNVFYTNKLTETHSFFHEIGVVITEYENNKVVITLGDFDIHYVLAHTEPCEDYKYITEEKNLGQGIIFYTEVEDLKTLYTLIEPSGGKLKSKIYENHWGCQEYLCEDPNGFKFAFYNS